jgi:hypothetical protein
MRNAAGTQSGTSETAADLSYNNAIAPGSTTTFGFQASFTGANAAPALSCAAG